MQNNCSTLGRSPKPVGGHCSVSLTLQRHFTNSWQQDFFLLNTYVAHSSLTLCTFKYLPSVFFCKQLSSEDRGWKERIVCGFTLVLFGFSSLSQHLHFYCDWRCQVEDDMLASWQQLQQGRIHCVTRIFCSVGLFNLSICQFFNISL